ncbi:hypothetical protein IFM89_008818 [Coptis chinensis]|uniref:RNase III domain-containing protein n=1 Tax=Coptis chinensis TaxID=261450 RepID=A0A835HDD9_9MAGN|nr:hypothetical protein IFM89_008818 [Coptis chinensis]
MGIVTKRDTSAATGVSIASSDGNAKPGNGSGSGRPGRKKTRLATAAAQSDAPTYPDLDPGQLWLLRASTINTEKLARVAVRHGLFHFFRHNAPSLDAKVNEFSLAIKKEQACEISAYGGKVKAPKVLVDIVEPVAAAVYVDAKIKLI